MLITAGAAAAGGAAGALLPQRIEHEAPACARHAVALPEQRVDAVTVLPPKAGEGPAHGVPATAGLPIAPSSLDEAARLPADSY